MCFGDVPQVGGDCNRPGSRVDDVQIYKFSTFGLVEGRNCLHRLHESLTDPSSPSLNLKNFWSLKEWSYPPYPF